VDRRSDLGVMDSRPLPSFRDLWSVPPDDRLYQFTRQCLLWSLLAHLVAAVFTEGFHHYDEQFQILEFVQYKLGRSPEADLPWEFRSQIRPWFMPALFTAFAKAWLFLGVDNPFTWALSFRLLSALLGWLSVAALVRLLFGWFRSEVLLKGAIVATSLLWFLPYIHARPSSESWSGSLFFLGFSFLMSAVQTGGPLPVGHALLSGSLMGLAFECRYQSAIFVVFGLLWSLRYGRFRLSAQGAIAVGLVAAVGLGTLADRWGYGNWSLAPGDYVRVNLLEGKAAQWGISPWWSYVPLVLLQGGPPISLLLIAGVSAAWVLKRRFSLTWCTVPFFAIHCGLGHKELRFLFPMAPAAPVLMVMALEALRQRGWPARGTSLGQKRWVRWGGLVLCAWNGVLCLISGLVPARLEVAFYRQIYARLPTVLYTLERDPYEIVGLRSHFYRPLQLTVVRTGSFERTLGALSQSGTSVWYFHPGLTLPDEGHALQSMCTIEYQALPRWLQAPVFSRWLRRIPARDWSLLRCQPGRSGARKGPGGTPEARDWRARPNQSTARASPRIPA